MSQMMEEKKTRQALKTQSMIFIYGSSTVPPKENMEKMLPLAIHRIV